MRISRHHLDLSDAGAITAFPPRVTAEHPGVDILVNNAGVALGGTFEQTAEGDFEWLFAINFWGVVRMTRAFLPLLHKSEEARIVNLSSLFGPHPARPPIRRASSPCGAFPNPCAMSWRAPTSA